MILDEREISIMGKLFDEVNFSSKIYDFIEESKGEGEVYIFGAGSLAGTVIERLVQAEIHITGILVDHRYYKENSSIKGFTIYDWDSFVKPNGAITVIMGMSDMKRGLEIEKKSFVKKVVYPGCLSFECNMLLTKDFLKERIDDYERIFNMCADDKSKKVMIAWLNSCILTYNPIIFTACEDKAGYFNSAIFDFSTIESYVNIGAYTGDTIDEFMMKNEVFETIYGVEGDKDLAAYLREKYIGEKRIKIVEKIFWKNNESVSFSHVSNANSVGGTVNCSHGSRNNGISMTAVTMDDFFTVDRGKIDLISVAFRGEENVLQGAKKLIQRDHPIIIAKVGFERDCIIKVIDTIYSVSSEYKYYLRFKDNRTEELTVYAL